jgi:3-oxoacyl-[acyl-carrier protein] reductase
MADAEGHSMELKDSVAIVTGGARGIGRGIAYELAKRGARIAIADLPATAGDRDETIAGIKKLGSHAIAIDCDVTNFAQAQAMVSETIDKLGRVDILVNNAGWNIGIPFPNIEDLTAEIWNRVHETNLRGPYLLSRAFAPHLRAHGAGRIVNIASVGGLRPSSSSIAYSASKAGLIHLTRCLAVALAPTVTVNCVAPGLVEGTRIAARLPEAVADGARRQAVLGRTGSIEDIAAQVVTFCRADSVTGQTLVVDGGMPGGMH